MTEIKLDDVIGHQDAKEALMERLELYTLNKQEYKDADARPPSGLLLWGAPGTGKTMLVKACYNSVIKNNPNFAYREIKLSDLSAGNRTGDAQRKIYDLFDGIRASRKENILIFDELDAICPERRKVSAVCTIERINSLLFCLDGTQGRLDNLFVIGTTNRPGMIDSAIKRTGRFDDIIEVGLPNLEESKLLASKYLKGIKIDADFRAISEAIGEYGYFADWAGSEYDALKTKLVGKYIKNNKIPLTAQQITVTVSQIRRSLTRTKEEYLL